MEPSIENKDLEYKKVAETDEFASRAEVEGNVSEIDCGIVEYVRKRMHCRTITRGVRWQAAAFQRDMDRMPGW